MPILILNYLKLKFQTLRTFVPNVEVSYLYPVSEMPICLSKQSINSPPIRQFSSFSDLGNVTGQVTIIKRFMAEESLKICFGESSFCSRSPRERYCQSFICSEHTFDPGLKPLEEIKV